MIVEPVQTRPCVCGKKLVLFHSGVDYIADPVIYLTEWRCYGCGAMSPGKSITGKSNEEQNRKSWEEMQS